MDLLSLVIFLAVILVAFFRKVNVGVLALGVGVIAVRIFGLSDGALISGISTSMFMTLVGITFLFAVVSSTGALDLLARKIIAMAGNRLWVIPILVYVSGFVIAGIGPGAVPALAIIPSLAVAIAYQVGYNPIMLGIIGTAGLMGGRMTPITPEAAIINEAAAGAGLEDVMMVILVSKTLISIVLSIVIYILYKGYKLKVPVSPIENIASEKFSSKQILALAGIVGMMILIIGFNVNLGLSALFMGVILILLNVADDAACIKALPWTTIVMILGVGALLSVVDEMGGITLMSDTLASIMTPSTATPIMGVSAGLMSLVSSALGVVYPTMMPMSVEIAAQVGGVHPVAMMAAVGAGGSLSGLSPMSTGGALIMAAMGAINKNFTKEDQSKTFNELLMIAALSLVIVAVVSALTFNLIANVMYPM